MMFEELSPPYSTIVADPPWQYDGDVTRKNAGEEWQKGAECPYSTMPSDEIAAMPVKQLAAKDAHLYLWVTNAFMEDGLRIVREWGFRTQTILTWGKVQPDGSPSMKVGYWFRSATEHVIFGVRGSVPKPDTIARPTLMLWPRIKAHSEKPAAFFDLVEQVSPGPYLELFCRRPRFGWDTWGKGYEVGS